MPAQFFVDNLRANTLNSRVINKQEQMERSESISTDVERLRADLDTIKQAIGDELPIRQTDVYFMWACSAATLFAAVLCHLGFSEWPARWVAAAPLFGVVAVYIVYWMRKSRKKSEVDAPMRKRYRQNVVLFFVGVAFLTLVRKWALGWGMDTRLFHGVLFVVGGGAALIAAYLPPISGKAYYRTTTIFGGSILIVMGLVHPILAKAYYITIPAIIGTVIFVGLAVIGQHFLSRQSLQQASSPDGRATSTN